MIANSNFKLNLSNFTVQQLRKQNIKVRINHKRRVAFIERGAVITKLLPKYEIIKLKTKGAQLAIFPTGGQTEVLVTHDGQDYVGKAFCLNSDNFCYKRGVSISLGKLVNIGKVVNPANL